MQKVRKCEKCGKEGTDSTTIIVHHDAPDNRPTMELCQQCHRKRHKELGWGVPGPGDYKSRKNVGLDGNIRDEVTGEIGGHFSSYLTGFKSRFQASLVMVEIASSSNWVVSGVNENGAVYIRKKGGVTEELKVEKSESRHWDIVRIVKQE